MAQDAAKPTGPDFAQGIELGVLADGGMLAGHVGDEEVVLVRQGTEIFAVGAHCTHYHAPLADGIGRHVLAAGPIFADDTPVRMFAPRTGKTRTARL